MQFPRLSPSHRRNKAPEVPIATTTGTDLLDTAEANIGGTGGGFSELEPTPSYQQGVSGTHNFHAVEYLTPTDFQVIAPGLKEPTDWNLQPHPRRQPGPGFRACPAGPRHQRGSL
jgi:hypothetical protein